MSRTALARTYRPKRFSEVATQEHVSETLRSAVQRNRVAHAYLFCGPRGVGKTTLARVLAMALNCPNRSAEGEPCGVCDSCERIWAGKTSLDVVEIDAASNRGVDDARELRERAMYAPSEEDRFKVYIIDEAHMLTREAWNALLKILEEPPPRVIFVFATTEPQKIQQAAPPILSRCQRFDFRRISTPDLVERLRTVLNAEGVQAGDDVLLPIALKADGGMRDGLSLLDQVLSFTEGVPTADDVRRILGLVGTEVFLDLFEVIADKRHADVFRFVARLLDEGYDLAEFYRGLADFLRSMLMVRLEGSDPEAVRADLRPAVAAMARRFAAVDLLRMLAQVAELDADGRFRKSGEQRILIELLLLRFAYMESTVSLEEVLAALGGGSASAGGGGGGERGNAPGRPAPAEPPAGRPAQGGGWREALGQSGVAPARSIPEPAPRSASPAPPGSAAAAPAPAASVPPASVPPAPVPTTEPPRAEPRMPEPAPAAPRAAAPPPSRSFDGPPLDDVPLPPEPDDLGADDGYASRGDYRRSRSDAYAPRPEPVSAPASPSAAGTAAGDGPPLTLNAVKQAWAAVLTDGEGVPPGSKPLLRTATLSVGEGRKLRINVPPPVLERLGTPAARRPLEEALAKRLGGGPVAVELVAGQAAPEERGAQGITAERARRDRLQRLMEGEPVLAAAVQAWDLELID